jgi:uncharacterized RDD family membrane protein YckC
MNISPSQSVTQNPAIWRRFAAMIYDSLLLLAVSMAYGGVTLAIKQLVNNSQEAFVSGPLFQLGWLVVLIGFFCYFWMKAGQTLGMRAWRLQIVHINHKGDTVLPTLTQCLGRCLLAPVGLLLFFTGLFRQDRQCLHDLWTKTHLILLIKTKK